MPAICKVIEPVIDEMVFEMFTKFGISAFHSQMTLASIVAFFCKFHTAPFNRSTSAVLQYFRERFPLDCACLFRILGAVLNWTTDIARRKEVMCALKVAVAVFCYFGAMRFYSHQKVIIECERLLDELGRILVIRIKFGEVWMDFKQAWKSNK